MRSSTSNKYMSLWDYDLKDYLNSNNRCAGIGGVWTLAEMAAAQGRPDGYFWSVRPFHRALGPDKRGESGRCDGGGNYRNSEEVVNIRCGNIEALCAGAQHFAGCPSPLWRHKLGFQWERSADKGLSWFRFPETAANLMGEKISIGMAAHRYGVIQNPAEDSTSPILPGKALRSASTFSATASFTQFYGVIDSVRISRGIARYTTQVFQPYDPAAPVSQLIDDFVIFGLNLGRNEYQVPGGTIFPYYIKERGKYNGWLVPGLPVYDAPNDDIIAPSLRNFAPHNPSLNDGIYRTDNSFLSLPVFALKSKPTAEFSKTGTTLPTLYSGGDVYFSSVWLLLPGDGTNGETTILDSSTNNNTVSRLGVSPPDTDISISTAQSKWGGSSIRFYFNFDGEYPWAINYSPHRLLCPLPANALTTQDWAIEAWVRPDAHPSYNYGAIFSTFVENQSEYGLDGITLQLSNGIIRVSKWNGFIISGGTYTANTWTHIALSYSSGTLRLYQDGAKIGETTTAFSSGGNLQIGNATVPGWDNELPFTGYIDDFRVTLGNDRGYTGATIPVPIEAFPTTSGPPTEPSAPRNILAAPDDNALFLLWDAPLTNGGSAITGYEIEYGAVGDTPDTVLVAASPRSFTLNAATHGIANGTEYSIRIAAVNAVGLGDYSAAVTATPSSNPADPYFDNVSLLFHFDPPANNFVQDYSKHAFNITVTGDVTTAASTPKYGTKSCSFTGGYLTAPTSPAFGFGTDDFTIEGWLLLVTQRSDAGFVSVGFYNDGLLWRVGTSGGSLWLNGNPYHWNPITYLGGSVGDGPEAFSHVALVRDSGVVRIYVNGQQVFSTPFSGNLGSSKAVTIGASSHASTTTSEQYSGYADDIRITKNVCRYPAGTAFLPPTRAFSDYGPLSTLADPPTDIIAQPNSGTIFTRWKKPTNTGGTAFLGYKFKYVPFGGSPVIIDLPPTAVNYSLTGLVNGTQYSVSLAAVNVLGVGAYSTPIIVTPSTNPPDAFFNSVALLVHFDGTNGSKKFVDYSLNNYTLTALGGAEVGTAQSKWGGASLKLTRSSGSYVSVNETALTTGLLTSDFTMECWFYATADGGTSCLVTTRHDPSPEGKIFCIAASRVRAGGGAPTIWCGAWDNNVGPNAWRAVVEGPAFDLNTWYHVAMTVSTTGQMALYVNGNRVGTATGAVLDSWRPMRELLIGRRWDNVDSYFTNDRWFEGYIDDVRITNTIRYTEAVEPVPPKSFPDYGVTSTVPSPPVDFAATAGDGRIWLSWLPPTNNGNALITGYRLEYFSGTSFPVVLDLPATPRKYVIQNVVNGVQYTLKLAAVNALGAGEFSPTITVTPAEVTDGYFDAVTLLLRMDEEAFFDSSKYSSDIMLFGAAISADQSAFGTRSGYFAGTGNRLEIADTDTQFYFDGDYTVEAWLYIPTLNTNNGGWFFSQAENETRNANRQYAFGVNSAGLRVYWTTNGSNDNFANFATTIPTNEWVHVAFCRVGSVLRAFVNGVKAGTDVAHPVTYFNSNATVCVGSFGRYRQNTDFVGYMSELRVTKNVARYVANFTKPGVPFPDRGLSTAAPQPPTHLSLSSAAEKIFVSWRKPADSGGLAISGYTVSYRALTGPDADIVAAPVLNSTKTSHTISLPGANTDHFYEVKVAAINKAGTSLFSAIKTITPGALSSGVVVPVDSEFNKVSLLLHFEGANDSTTFLDSADNRVPTVSGAKISTAQKISGNASGSFGNHTLTYSTARNFGFGRDEFTIEMYVRANMWTNYGSTPNNDGRFGAGDENAVATFGSKLTWRLRAGLESRVAPGTWWNAWYPAISLVVDGLDYTWIEAETVTSPPANTWVHVAMTRVGNRLRIYIDGAKKFDRDIGPVDFLTQLPFVVGSFNGFIDELRITRGFARYASGDFTPQQLPFADRDLNVTPPTRVAKVKAQGLDTSIMLSWQRPFDENNRSGSRTTGYKIQYRTYSTEPFDDACTTCYTTIDTESPLTTHTLTNLTNGLQYQIRVAAYNEAGMGPWSFYIPCTPTTDEFNYIDVHNYLTYTNHDDGYLGRCGIKFPYVPATDASDKATHPPTIAQALVLHDALIPPRIENRRVIYADCATTGAENPPLIAAADGRFYGKDKFFDNFKAIVNSRVLVKNQDDAFLNGVYTVRFDDNDSKVAWERIRNPQNTGLENFFGTRVVILNGEKNVGTVWNCTNDDVPIINQTPLVFERDVLLGLRQEDFCVEAYFKAHRFRQPPLDINGVNMTLLDTYYRADMKDQSTAQFSGLRIYFSAVLSGKQGYVHVDVGTYFQSIDTLDNARIITEKSGPALRSKLLSTDVFYHVAVTRADDTFRLYIDGELQDQFIAQETTYEPLNLTAETNHIRYRVRPYFGLYDYSGLATQKWIEDRHISQYGRFNVARSEFFFKREAANLLYSERFNGAALMVEVGRGNQDDILNLPPAAGEPASWPGKPIPDYPADTHVYIFRNFDRDLDGGFDMKFVVAPSLRFPPETAIVDLATVPANATYQPGFGDCASNCPPIPNRGNIPLFGLFSQGSKAKGIAAFLFSSSAEFVIPRNLALNYGAISFTPRSNYKVVQKDDDTALAPTEGEIVFILSAPTPFAVLNTLRLQTPADPSAGVANYVFAPKQTYNAVYKPGVTVPGPNELLITEHTEPNRYKVVVPVIAVGAAGTAALVAAIVEASSPFTFNTVSPNPPKPLTVIAAFAATAFTSELKIAFNNPDYSVSVPAACEINTVLGNIGPNTEFTNDISGFIPASRDAAFIRAFSSGSFSGGADNDNKPLKIDGVPVSAGMRILVKDQANPRENGIYVAQAAAWTRAADMDQTEEIIGANRTRRIFVEGGYKNSNVAYVLDIPTSIVDANVFLGATDLPFVKDPAADTTPDPFIVYVQQGFAIVPVTNPDDYQSMQDSVSIGDGLGVQVTAVSTANLTLSGAPPASSTDGWPMPNGSILLVRMQTLPEENGIYVVNHSGPWSRLPRLSLSRQFPSELVVSPVQGMSVPLIEVPGSVPTVYVPEHTVAYRMRIQPPPNQPFVVNLHPIVCDDKEIVRKIHLPFLWANTTKFEGTGTGSLPTSTGGKIVWEDFIPDNVNSTQATSNDTVSWRVFLRCGNTIAYSRTVVLRAASKIGIKTKTSVRVDT